MESGSVISMKNVKLPPSPPPPPPSQLEGQSSEPPQRPIWQIIMVAAIAAGVQFGWALQLSLLTPYVQLLGIPHKWAAAIWLCGPISGMIVQPVVGYYSDRCTSRFGRRRHFIAGGSVLVAIAVFLIGYAADIGVASGDKAGNSPKPRAISVFVIGFWILDVANNMLQGPCRALLADLSGSDSRRIKTGNSLFAFFMAVGNVLGYAAGSYKNLHKMLPFTQTHACDVYCANLKTCFFISVALLLTVTVLALTTVTETVIPTETVEEERKVKRLVFFEEMTGAFKLLSRPMWILLLVTCLNWIAWFPFMLFDTDWMGREVYGGKLKDGETYSHGVSAGAMGLLLNSVVAGVASLGMDRLTRVCCGVKRLWGGVNLLLAVCLAMTVLVTKMADHGRRPSDGVLGGAFAIFAVLGIPLSVTYSIPCALASIFSNDSGVGQGLSLGVLNLAIVIPQMFVSVLSVGAIAAAISGILAFTLLPSPPQDVVLEKVSGVPMH
ncbi:hypothetical protein L1987_66372 [Smallanthus sonchifolius]|uniref:Uncharacterized protein n=1 Tax=Smallanthus sonchifolius TaxID=185202 RepID=A0ACB9BWY4_9ASTR|nr:hypothetical protein L1987_66372 [Smallanthus sonchifolius]